MCPHCVFLERMRIRIAVSLWESGEGTPLSFLCVEGFTWDYEPVCHIYRQADGGILIVASPRCKIPSVIEPPDLLILD